MLVTCWIFFAFLMNIFYNVEFRSYLIAPEFETPINDFKDINVKKAVMFYASSGYQDRQYVHIIPMDIYHDVLFASYTDLYTDCLTNQHYGRNIDWTDFSLKRDIHEYLVNCGGSVLMYLEEFNSFAVEWMSRKETYNKTFLLRHSTADPVNISMKNLNIIMNHQKVGNPESVTISLLRILQTGIVDYFGQTPLYYDVTKNPNEPEFSGTLTEIRIEHLEKSFEGYFVFIIASIILFLFEYVNFKKAFPKVRIQYCKEKSFSHLKKLARWTVKVALILFFISSALLLLGFIIVEVINEHYIQDGFSMGSFG